MRTESSCATVPRLKCSARHKVLISGKAGFVIEAFFTLKTNPVFRVRRDLEAEVRQISSIRSFRKGPSRLVRQDRFLGQSRSSTDNPMPRSSWSGPYRDRVFGARRGRRTGWWCRCDAAFARLDRQAGLGAIEHLIWLFSSIETTTAWAGGFIQSPTTSSTFSAKTGSFDFAAGAAGDGFWPPSTPAAGLARLVAQQPVYPFREALPPPPSCWSAGAGLPRHLPDRRFVGRQQDDTSPLDMLVRAVRSPTIAANRVRSSVSKRTQTVWAIPKIRTARPRCESYVCISVLARFGRRL